MLLNLSNHPSPSWPPNQLATAHQLYGEVEDLPFPPIDPDWATEEVQQLAAEYFEKVVQRRPAAVHLMGEMTFTFALVQMLKAAGIPCLASTTRRNVTEEGGKKIVQFQFVQFRPY